jgi:hypothetical protein
VHTAVTSAVSHFFRTLNASSVEMANKKKKIMIVLTNNKGKIRKIGNYEA